eukprot:CAMPEP_0197574826 /NCGR_PEP_ID=MMETSP1326-20131121/427_1 /TAXON_ID=1155430 /ORGANISM="Genus nov. species nov., Strain RCC2288" /LENGTH=149 /DNA_ID=CAMNT_0043137473 /DNA_START=698 /DNA_END=1147 /DNA_ORIENTATION=+
MPLIKWARYTGSRTDVMIGRGAINGNLARDTSNYTLLIGRDVAARDIPHLHPALLGDPGVSYNLYRTMTIPPVGRKPRGPTTGLIQLLSLISSGLCRTVNVFGMCYNGGGHYFDFKDKMKIHHSCELESWALHHLMKKHYDVFHMCLWT